MPLDPQQFQPVANSHNGRQLVRHLREYLMDLDRISRKLRGEALLENTIRRQFVAEFIDCFNEIPEGKKVAGWNG